MSKLAEVARTVCISPEAFWIAVMAGMAFFRPQWVIFFGNAFLSVESIAVAVIGAPFGLLVYTYKMTNDVRRPASNQLALRGWTDYWRLKIRLTVGLVYSLVGAFSVLLGWGLFRGGQKFAGSVLTVAGMGLSAIVVGTVAYARHSVEDIIDGFE